MRVMAVLALVGMTAATAPADQPPVPTFSADASLVNVTVSVASKKSGQPLENLTAQDFHVLEDQVLQEVVLCERQELPIDLMLMIDTSLSMGIVHLEQQTPGTPLWGELSPAVKQAAKDIIDSLGPQDRAAIIPFASGANMLRESVEVGIFSKNREFLHNSIDSLVARDNTRLYLVLYTVLRVHLPKQDPAHPRRTVIVLITDGEDTASTAFDDKSVRDLAKKSPVAIYPIELPHTTLGDPQRQKIADEAHAFLQKLADESGGFLQTPADNYRVAEASRQIIRELGVQYRLGYRPTNDKHDGTWRQLVVTVAGRTDLFIRHRAGYTAPRQ